MMTKVDDFYLSDEIDSDSDEINSHHLLTTSNPYLAQALSPNPKTPALQPFP
jgi:hypothetical protein